jgi:hypothetical protein
MKPDYVLEKNLRVNATYKGKTGNTFILFRGYEPNSECFRRQDGQLHFGREFIAYEHGETVLTLSEIC